MSHPLVLHPDRAMPPDPGVRAIARALYQHTRDLPLVCLHGHVDAGVFADDAPFPDPARLLITPDHYVTRMLVSQGADLAGLGIPLRGGGQSGGRGSGQGDGQGSGQGGPAAPGPQPREIWRRFCSCPGRCWTDSGSR